MRAWIDELGDRLASRHFHRALRNWLLGTTNLAGSTMPAIPVPAMARSILREMAEFYAWWDESANTVNERDFGNALAGSLENSGDDQAETS